MVRRLLSRHSQRSRLHPGLWHLLFRQLRVRQNHAAADLGHQVREENESFSLFHSLCFSFHSFIFPSPSFAFSCSFSLCFFLSSFISLPGVMVAVITIRKGDSSVITGCQHTGSFLYHLRPKTKSHAFIFLSGDCEGHTMSSSNSQFKWFRQDFSLWPDLMLTIIRNCGCIWLY